MLLVELCVCVYDQSKKFELIINDNNNPIVLHSNCFILLVMSVFVCDSVMILNQFG